MTKKDTPSQRLAEAIEYERRQRKVMTNLADIGRGLRDPHPVPGMEADRRRAGKLHRLFHKNDEDDNSLLAVAALQIDGAPESLRTAFEEHELDPNEPWDWRGLLIRFAHAHYGGGRRRAGAPKRYDESQVLEDYAAIRRKHPKSGDEDLFRFMKSSFPHRYKTYKTAKKRFNRALNKLRENYSERVLKMARASKEKDGIQWTPKVAAEVRKQLRAASKSAIAQYWGRGGRDKTHT
jgi:hypothetical protein